VNFIADHKVGCDDAVAVDRCVASIYSTIRNAATIENFVFQFAETEHREEQYGIIVRYTVCDRKMKQEIRARYKIPEIDFIAAHHA